MRTFLIATLILLVGIVGVGYGMGWLPLESATRPDGTPAGDNLTEKRMRVILVEVNVPERLLRAHGSQLDEYRFQVTADTQIRRRDRDIPLEALQPGDRAVVVYVEKGDRNLARTITAE
jgi:hypothetical protein